MGSQSARSGLAAHMQTRYKLKDANTNSQLKLYPLAYYPQNTIKDPHWYVVQGSDTTMMSRAPSARTIKSTAHTNIER